MPHQFSDAVRSARADVYESTIGTSPRLQIRTGAPPANCAAADTGTLLCEMTLPADWLTTATAGAKALNGTWAGTGSAAGVAGHFRIRNSAGTVVHHQGTVTGTGGGGDMTLTNVNIAAGQAVSVSAFNWTEGGA